MADGRQQGPLGEIAPVRQAATRLQLFEGIVRGALAQRLKPMSFWLPTVETLRYRLGTGLADANIPMGISSEIEKIFENAVASLAAHFISRHRKLITDHAYDQFISRSAGAVTATPPMFFGVPLSVQNPRIRSAIADAMTLCPYLDSGILMGWLGGRGPGIGLLQLIAGLLRKATAEADLSEEETPYLVQLYLLPRMQQAMRQIRDGGLEGSAATLTETACGVALFLVHYAAVEQVLSEAGSESAPVSPRVAALMRSMVNPLLTTGGSSALRRSGGQPYGIDLKLYRDLQGDAHLKHLCEGGSPMRKPQEISEQISGDKTLRAAVAEWAAVDTLRRAMRHTLADERWVANSETGQSLRQLLWEMYREPNRLAASLREKRFAPDLSRRIETQAGLLPRGVVCLPLNGLAILLKRYKPSSPLKGLGRDADDAVERFCAHFSAMLCDMVVERAIHPIRLIDDRGRVEPASELDQDYGNGRLYLISREEDKPILARRAQTPDLAHLFVDVKDFTRRTVLLKEEVMADFLRKEFYGPILSSASQFHKGASHHWDRGGIMVNALLGDAISFSGDIVSLVEVARSTRQTLDEYELKLRHLLTQDVLQPILREIDARYADREAAIDAELRQLADERSRFSGAGGASVGAALHTLGDVEARREWLEDERRRLEDEKTEERFQIQGAELKAGVFISYGPAPRMIELDDPVFGEMSVSIAEKINESARGTARNGAVRDWIDGFVAEQKTKPNYHDFENAFKVLIGGVMGAPVGFYNVGVALSLDALRAYIEARSDEFSFVEHAMGGHEVHPEIARRFCLPRGRLDIVAAMEQTTGDIAEIFVYAGAARFKGFESKGTTDVYEWIAPDTPFFAAIRDQQAPLWAQQAAAAQAGMGGAGLPG